jgi:ribosomal protein S27E
MIVITEPGSEQEQVDTKLICNDCGSEMIVSGHCATCPNCGYSLCSM